MKLIIAYKNVINKVLKSQAIALLEMFIGIWGNSCNRVRPCWTRKRWRNCKLLNFGRFGWRDLYGASIRLASARAYDHTCMNSEYLFSCRSEISVFQKDFQTELQMLGRTFPAKNHKLYSQKIRVLQRHFGTFPTSLWSKSSHLGS